MKLYNWIKSLFEETKAEDIICPHCGYYCLGNGGFYCIDKPSLQDKDK